MWIMWSPSEESACSVPGVVCRRPGMIAARYRWSRRSGRGHARPALAPVTGRTRPASCFPPGLVRAAQPLPQPRPAPGDPNSASLSRHCAALGPRRRVVLRGLSELPVIPGPHTIS
jgi:hypothetical protein